jgi:hypothetical protein
MSKLTDPISIGPVIKTDINVMPDNNNNNPGYKNNQRGLNNNNNRK